MNTLADWIVSQGKTPRPYQERTINALDDALDRGKRPLIVLPTGGGKSFVMRAGLRRFRKTMVSVHTNTLFDQTRQTVPNASVATVQSLIAPGKLGDARRQELWNFDGIAIDEGHHYVADEFGAWLPHLNPDCRLFLVTATPQRADGTPMGDVADELIVGAKYSELVRGGYLCACDVARPSMRRKDQRKFKQRPDGVASYLETARRADGTWRPGIYFDRTKAKCREAVLRFGEAGVRAALVCDETPSRERQTIFDAYSRGELDMLCSPQALAEGFDSIRAEVCVLCRSAQYVGPYLQMCGRVLRPYTAANVAEAVAHWTARGFALDPAAMVPKDRALLIDCSDAFSLHNSPTADRDYSLEGDGITISEEQPLEPEQPELVDDEESEGGPVDDGYIEIKMKFDIVRDQLRDVYQDTRQRATERGYRDGWLFHRFTERTGIQPPRLLEAQHKSTCAECRKKVAIGEKIFWHKPDGAQKGTVHHQDCWFASLKDDQLLRADAMNPKTRRVFAAAKPKSEPPPVRRRDEFVPF